jgi:hypothetical protein
VANLKWNSAPICLEAKWSVATAGLLLAREQSLPPAATVRLLILLAIANTPRRRPPPTPVLLTPVTYLTYTTCLLPYQPASTFSTAHCCRASDPSVWVHQPSPPLIAVPLPRWICDKSTSPLPGHCHCNYIVLRSVEASLLILPTSTCIEQDEGIIVTSSVRLLTKHHLNHTSYEIDVHRPRKSSAPTGVFNWIP